MLELGPLVLLVKIALVIEDVFVLMFIYKVIDLLTF